MNSRNEDACARPGETFSAFRLPLAYSTQARLFSRNLAPRFAKLELELNLSMCFVACLTRSCKATVYSLHRDLYACGSSGKVLNWRKVKNELLRGLCEILYADTRCEGDGLR